MRVAVGGELCEVEAGALQVQSVRWKAHFASGNDFVGLGEVGGGGGAFRLLPNDAFGAATLFSEKTGQAAVTISFRRP